MNEFFIVMGGGMYGHYGKGATLEAAHAAYRKAGGKRRGVMLTENRFTSELPFAPFDRKAEEGEADAWVGQDGSLNWVRCERELIGRYEPKVKAKK